MEQPASCLNVTFGVNGKKRKSATSTFEETSRVDADHITVHNLSTPDELSDDIDASKRRRHTDNSAGNDSPF